MSFKGLMVLAALTAPEKTFVAVEKIPAFPPFFFDIPDVTVLS